MINTGLDSKLEAKEQKSFELIPKGRYTFEVKTIKPWKPTTKDVMVNLTDANGRVLRDEKGNIQREMVKNLTFYNADYELRILGGEHDGRIVFGSLTTHPNTRYITEHFLYAIGEATMLVKDIPALCVGKRLDADVVINEDNVKKTTDKVTGVTREEKSPRNEIRAFYKPSAVVTPIGADEI